MPIAAAPQSLDLLERVLHLDVDGFDVSDEALAENREFDAARQTREERNAEFLLERADALGQCGLRHADFAGCGRDAEMPRDRQKITELFEVHGPVRGWTDGLGPSYGRWRERDFVTNEEAQEHAVSAAGGRRT